MQLVGEVQRTDRALFLPQAKHFVCCMAPATCFCGSGKAKLEPTERKIDSFFCIIELWIGPVGPLKNGCDEKRERVGVISVAVWGGEGCCCQRELVLLRLVQESSGSWSPFPAKECRDNPPAGVKAAQPHSCRGKPSQWELTPRGALARESTWPCCSQPCSGGSGGERAFLAGDQWDKDEGS